MHTNYFIYVLIILLIFNVLNISQATYIIATIWCYIQYIQTYVTLSVKSRLKSQNLIMRKQASDFDFYH